MICQNSFLTKFRYLKLLGILIITFSLQGCKVNENLQEIDDVLKEEVDEDSPEEVDEDIVDSVEPDSIFNQNSQYIAVIGDIQEYSVSDERINYFNKTNVWLRAQQKYFSVFSCILQNGDLTWGNQKIQWERVDSSLNYLGDNLLFIPSIGNHDYTWGGSKGIEINDRNSTGFNLLKNLSVLRKQKMLQFEKGKLDNIIVPIKIGADTLYVIALEFGPRKEVVLWADSIVRENSRKKYILMTHEWLTRPGQRIVEGSYADMQFPNISHSTPEEIWKKMVYPNDNILCVLCGHNGFCKYLYSKNKAGREVCQILFNLQYQENGGDGMIQLWEFPKEKNKINIFVYNTIKREFHHDPETNITIQF